MYVKLKYEILSNEILMFFFQNVLGLLYFWSCQNCMRSANLVAEVQLKISNKRVFKYWRTIYL